MTTTFRTAKQAAKPRMANGLWLDHAVVSEDDLDWLKNVERLTLWNVKLPKGFLAKLSRLWWVDVRGGAGEDLLPIEGASGLKYLAVNQVRGLSNLSSITSFKELRLLSLYGLAKVTQLPSLRSLANLERAEIGQMKTLTSITPVLDAPNLKELLLTRKLNVSLADAGAISKHPGLERFQWSAEDVAVKVWEPVVESIHLPKTRPMHPEEWFGLQSDAQPFAVADGFAAR